MSRVSPLKADASLVTAKRSFLMRYLARQASLVASLLLWAMLPIATAQTAQRQGTGIITGRVTFGEKPAANVPIALYPVERAPGRRAVARTTTDFEGRYRIVGVPTGRFNVVPIAPAFVGPNQGLFGEMGKTITIAESETVEKIDFALTRGGVITGRVTDADGSPVIGERVHLAQPGKQEGWRSFSTFNQLMYMTDDRGIYRIYGLAPGKYTVSVGEEAGSGAARFGFSGRGYYARTFHPDVTEEAKATVIELGEGSEASNVDIVLGRKAKSFTATGRVVDEQGKPVAGVRIGNGALVKEGNRSRIGGMGWGSQSDAEGRFRLDGLVPGRYAAFVWSEDNLESYSDAVTYEISDGDIQGLEIKLRRGSSISGVVVIEGTTDKATLAKLSQLSIGASVEGEGVIAPNFANVKIAPDGSFRLTGLRHGKLRLYLATYPPPKGFTLARVEREGVAQQEFEIAPGAQLSGFRVVIEYGTGSIRGLVKVENGTLPAEARTQVYARRRSDVSEMMGRGAQVDSRGRFLIEGLPTGDYELTVRAYVPGVVTRSLPQARQSVVVTNGIETEITLTLDLSAKQPEGGNNE
jgi:protocatechuate 3,4-dioxygenase beta subunit